MPWTRRASATPARHGARRLPPGPHCRMPAVRCPAARCPAAGCPPWDRRVQPGGLRARGRGDAGAGRCSRAGPARCRPRRLGGPQRRRDRRRGPRDPGCLAARSGRGTAGRRERAWCWRGSAPGWTGSARAGSWPSPTPRWCGWRSCTPWARAWVRAAHRPGAVVAHGAVAQRTLSDAVGRGAGPARGGGRLSPTALRGEREAGSRLCPELRQGKVPWTAVPVDTTGEPWRSRAPVLEGATPPLPAPVVRHGRGASSHCDGRLESGRRGCGSRATCRCGSRPALPPATGTPVLYCSMKIPRFYVTVLQQSMLHNYNATADIVLPRRNRREWTAPRNDIAESGTYKFSTLRGRARVPCRGRGAPDGNARFWRQQA